MFNSLTSYSPVRLCVFYSVYISTSSYPCSIIYLRVYQSVYISNSLTICVCVYHSVYISTLPAGIYFYHTVPTCPSVRLYFYPSVIAFFVLFCLIFRIFNMLTFSYILFTWQLTTWRCILNTNIPSCFEMPNSFRWGSLSPKEHF